MSLNVGELHARLGLQSRDFDSGLDSVGSRWGLFGGNLLRSAGVLAVGVGAAFAGMAAKGVTEFASLQKGMNEVFTLMPDISEKAMSEMTAQVREFSKEFGTLPDEVVPALYQAISAGVPRDNVFDFLETAQKAAIGGVTELATAVDGISSVVNAYGEDVVSATQASDLMFTAVRLGKTNFEELSASLFNVIPTAASLGVRFEDVTAALAAMTAQGTPTSVATTQMRQMLVELSKEGSATAATFEGIAGQSFRQFIASGGNVEQALSMMATEAEKSGGSISDMFGSVEAGAAAAQLTSESGAQAFAGALGEMADSAGATEAAFGRMDTGLSRSWDRIKASVNDAVIGMGERLAPFVQKVADWMEDELPRAIGAFSDAWTRAVELIGPTVERIRSLFDGLSSTGGSMGEKLQEVFAAAQSYIAKATEIISAVVGTMTEWFDENREQIEEIFGKIRVVVETAMEAIGLVIEVTVGIITALWEIFGDTILALLKNVWSTITGIFSGALSVIQGILDVFIGIFTGDWSRAWEGVKSIFSGVWEIIKSVVVGAVENVKIVVGDLIETLGEWFSDLPGNVLGWLGDTASLLVEKGADIVRGLWEGIKAMGSWLKDKIVGWAKSVIPGPIAAALGISSPSKLMEQMMREVPRGMVLGMERGTQDVMRAADNLASAAAPNADRMAAALASDVRGGASSLAIQVETTGDAKVLAREIERESSYRLALGG